MKARELFNLAEKSDYTYGELKKHRVKLSDEEREQAMKRFENMNYLVTGGSSGIGLATARRLVSEGANVVITGSNADKLRVAGEETGAVTLLNDAADSDQAAALGPWIQDNLGSLDGAFNAIGVVTSPVAEDTLLPRVPSVTIPQTAGLSATPGGGWIFRISWSSPSARGRRSCPASTRGATCSSPRSTPSAPRTRRRISRPPSLALASVSPTLAIWGRQ